MSTGFYDTAQVCLNGHLINDNARMYPAHNQPSCAKCGEKTTVTCDRCGAEIRGSYEVPDVAFMGEPSPPPNFCHNCGSAYPWTERRLEAAKYLAEEFDQLTEAEIVKLKDSLDDLTRETPKAELARTRFKKLMSKAGKEALSSMKSLLTDVLSEAVKKSLFGG